MPIGSRIVSSLCLFLVALLSHGALGIACAADPVLPRVVIRHHELFVQIVPEQHALIAQDRLTLEVPESQTSIRFSLAPTLQIDHIAIVQESSGSESLIHDVPFELEHGSAPESVQEVSIPSQVVPAGMVTLDVHYHGVIDDPPRDPRHLRFVTPSETAGHIGPEGIYVSSESHWYPDIPESLSTYALLVAVPTGWTVVTQGKAGESRACPAGLCRSDQMVITDWAVTQPSEAVTLVANTFVATFRDYTTLPAGDARFIPVRSDPDRIHTCFLEEAQQHVRVHLQRAPRIGARSGGAKEAG
jgi:hypothetical protein